MIKEDQLQVTTILNLTGRQKPHCVLLYRRLCTLRTSKEQ